MASKVKRMYADGAAGLATVMANPSCDPSILRTVSVLVVEDAWHVAKAMKGVLEQLGMHVLGPVATTLEARRLLTIQRPRAAVVDVNLRGEMAWDLVDDLREQDTGGGKVVVELAGLCLGGANAYQVARNAVPFGEPVQGLTRLGLLNDLPLELDRISALRGHGPSPRKPGPDSPILTPSTCPPAGVHSNRRRGVDHPLGREVAGAARTGRCPGLSSG